MNRYILMAMLLCSCGGGGTATDGVDGRAGDIRFLIPDIDVVFIDGVPQPSGDFGQPCDGSGDCADGWCVDHLGESVCSRPCDGDCPEGWDCVLMDAGTAAEASVCLSRFPVLCRPCQDSTGCKSVGRSFDHCIAYGTAGQFCGGGCTAEADCPVGYKCQETEMVEGLSLKQCVNEAGVCECTDTAISQGLWTPCLVENEHGACPGKRVCEVAGLSPCSGPTPMPEACNAMDDDCDGTVDEDSCDDGNDCTTDSCDGQNGCSHQPLDGGSCGGVCMPGGHCEAGVCVGAEPLVCNDNNPCTDDDCDPESGCAFEPNSDPCDDGDPCTIDDSCQGGVCAGQPGPGCVTGETSSVPCGNCGTQMCECTGECTWGNCSACEGEGACSPGQTEEETQGCGGCAAQTRSRTCGDDCQWGAWGAWSQCQDIGEGECEPGQVDSQEEACGSCGSRSRSRTCSDECAWGDWGDWGDCTGQGDCSPGQKENQTQGCGNCGSQTRSRTCTNACSWGSWSAWGSCTGQGTCSPGQTTDGGCDHCSQKVCKNNCTWSGCQLKPGSQCEWKQGTHWKCCAPGKWHFCLYSCVWSTDCSPCTGCGCN